MNITLPLRLAATAVLVAALGACAYPGQLQTGTSVTEATSKYGAPVVERPLPGGGKRLIWTTQPLGQYAWRADADASGTIRSVTQVLSTPEFDRLSQGTWTKDRLLGEFGPPAEVSTVGFRTSTEVWSRCATCARHRPALHARPAVPHAESARRPAAIRERAAHAFPHHRQAVPTGIRAGERLPPANGTSTATPLREHLKTKQAKKRKAKEATMAM